MLSHSQSPEPWSEAADRIGARIRSQGDLPHVTVDEQLDLLAQLTQFPFGRFLLCNRGWNGYWTHYAVYWHPRHGRHGQADESGRPYTGLESALLDLPVCRATQERFVHFQAVLQTLVREGVAMASLPCGLMDDLLSLDFKGIETFNLTGIDLDPDALRLAADNASRAGLSHRVTFRNDDGWQAAGDRYDVLTSNGLNIYEPDDSRVVALYRAFADRLGPSGVLVTSYLVPPAEQQTAGLDPEQLRLQRVILGDILAARWSCYRTTEQTRAQLREAGFEVTDILRDRASYFLTVVARRV